MFCRNCGKEIDDNAAVCIHCGVATANIDANKAGSTNMTYHEVSKCKKCGYTGEFECGKLFRTMDWVIGLVLLLFCGLGFFYFIIIAIIRYDKNKREKICPHCGGVDTATEFY